MTHSIYKMGRTRPALHSEVICEDCNKAKEPALFLTLRNSLPRGNGSTKKSTVLECFLSLGTLFTHIVLFLCHWQYFPRSLIFPQAHLSLTGLEPPAGQAQLKLFLLYCRGDAHWVHSPIGKTPGRVSIFSVLRPLSRSQDADY